MAKILTPITTLLEHYLSLKYIQSDFPRVIDRLDITGATTLNTTISSTQVALNTLLGSKNLSSGNVKMFLSNDAVTDPATDCVVTLKDGATTIGTATILAHSGIDTAVQFVCTNPFTATPALTVTITGGTAGCTFSIWILDDTVAWMDLGQNFNESISFQDGVIAVPVPRGWNATAFQKRTRSGNSMNLKQLYASNLEGVSNLKGKTILIKDEIHTDGGATIKEVNYYVACSVVSVSNSIGTSGQEQADMVDATGYYMRGYTVTNDATAQTAMA